MIDSIARNSVKGGIKENRKLMSDQELSNKETSMKTVKEKGSVPTIDLAEMLARLIKYLEVAFLIANQHHQHTSDFPSCRMRELTKPMPCNTTSLYGILHEDGSVSESIRAYPLQIFPQAPAAIVLKRSIQPSHTALQIARRTDLWEGAERRVLR